MAKIGKTMPHQFRVKAPMVCEVCGKKALKYVGAKTCSNNCRQKAHQDRIRDNHEEDETVARDQQQRMADFKAEFKR